MLSYAVLRVGPLLPMTNFDIRFHKPPPNYEIVARSCFLIALPKKGCFEHIRPFRKPSFLNPERVRPLGTLSVNHSRL